MKNFTPGTLFLVATPIGNIDDITIRALRVLQEVHFVYCEDTRHSARLLQHHKIKTKKPIESFHDHSSQKVMIDLVKKLSEGKEIAYITDAGMPGVSDPGFVLVRAALSAGAKVQVVPGPNAAVALFAMSNLPSPKFLFHGFFPRTRPEVERVLEVVKALPIVHIFYEASSRIKQSLEILNRNIPNADLVLGRELTKLYEETLRGKIEKVYEEICEKEKIRGECVFAVMGGVAEKEVSAVQSAEQNKKNLDEQKLSLEQEEEIASLVKAGLSSKDTAKVLSKKFKMPRRIIYEFIIRHLT